MKRQEKSNQTAGMAAFLLTALACAGMLWLDWSAAGVDPGALPGPEHRRQAPDAIGGVDAPSGPELDGDPLRRELVDLLPDQWLAHTVVFPSRVNARTS